MLGTSTSRPGRPRSWWAGADRRRCPSRSLSRAATAAALLVAAGSAAMIEVQELVKRYGSLHAPWTA